MLLDQRAPSPGYVDGKSDGGTAAPLSTLQLWPAVLIFVDQFGYDSSVAHLARATIQNSIFGHAENLLGGLLNHCHGEDDMNIDIDEDDCIVVETKGRRLPHRVHRPTACNRNAF
jgi:hypothetical protein